MDSLKNRPKILLTGKNGQVGWELRRTLAPLGQVVAVGTSDVNFCDEAALRSFVRSMRPNLIINPAAYTTVDRAESDSKLCFAINTQAPAILAEEAGDLNIPLLHYSTDYVFDGTKNTPYTESDSPNPLNVYGQSKLEGELAVVSSGARHIILRLSWVYGMRGNNFLLTMIRLANEKKLLNVVNDQIGAPTWCRMIAEASAQIVHRLHTQPEDTPSGIYHLPAGGSTSWFEFAGRIFDLGEGRYFPKKPKLLPIPTEAYPTPATRPHSSLLSSEKIQDCFGILLPDWEEQLRFAMAEGAL